MIVPIDLLRPILDDLLKLGRVDAPPRPWLGMYTSEAEGAVFVAGLAEGGPAHKAGVEPGDLVLEVGGQRVTDLAATFRKIWSLGPAGADIPLTIAREGQPQTRPDPLRRPQRFPQEAAAALGCALTDASKGRHWTSMSLILVSAADRGTADPGAGARKSAGP